MKELGQFLSSNPMIDFLLIRFPHLPPTFIGLDVSVERRIFLAIDMVDIAERREVGVLRVLRSTNIDKSKIEERFAGGRITALEYLENPIVDRICGVRLVVEKDIATVLAGDAPYSIYFEFREVIRGCSEFEMSEYRVVPPNFNEASVRT
jgi:hypothetical protein